MMNDSKTRKALVSILAGVVLLGTGPLFVKSVEASGLVIAFYRLLFASLMLTIPAAIQKQPKSGANEKKSAWIWGILGGLAYALNIALWSTALKYTTASAVTLLDNTAPVWVGIFGWIVLKEKQRWSSWLAILLTLSGAALLIGTDAFSGSRQQMLGNLMSIASGCSYALYQIVTRKARILLQSLQYSWMVSVVGSVCLVFAAMPYGLFSRPLDYHGYIQVFVLALTSQVIAWLLVNQALGDLPASFTSIALVGQPVVTTILAAVLLKEIPGILQITGGLICLLGVFMVQRITSRSGFITSKLDA